MDSTEQAMGERQVRELLIEGLEKRGLAKPASLTKAQFAEMVKDLCARLAYMSKESLLALEEQAAANAGGKEKDRFPVGQRILEWAAHIQPPGDDASPLIRKVFASPLGQDALVGGWAPELLSDLRAARRWPVAWHIKAILDKADGPMRQMRDLDARMARGDDLTPSERQWRQHRRAVIEKCQHIADLGRKEGGMGHVDG